MPSKLRSLFASRSNTERIWRVNVAEAAGAVPQNVKFQVVDLGQGRVALKAADGRLVSVVKKPL